MKKLIPFAILACVSLNAVAQEEISPAATPQQPVVSEESVTWPAPVALYQWPEAHDVVGLRLTIPCSTVHENVTGVDLGFWGRSIYFEGIQFNVIRNDVRDSAAGVQFGLYNTIAFGDMLGAQVGLWNEAVTLTGAQVGIINVVGEGNGFQVGIVNRAETFYGYQVGLINVIRDAELKFMPIVNIGF